MTDIDRLFLAGEALYGRSWQSQVADLLNVDTRRIRQWIAQERPIPSGIWHDLERALRGRGHAALALARVLVTGQKQAEAGRSNHYVQSSRP
jgi:hypothetical protein